MRPWRPLQLLEIKFELNNILFCFTIIWSFYLSGYFIAKQSVGFWKLVCGLDFVLDF